MHLAVTAIGADRPGIVASVTEVLTDRGANIEDSTMSILRGHFAMMLVVAAGADEHASALEAALAPVAERFGLVVAVRAIDDTVPRSPDGDAWTVSVYGADRPGIVHRVTAALADAGANVVDLTTRVIGDASRPVYAMVLDVTLPAGVEPGTLQQRLTALAAELGVDCSLHPNEADIL